MRYCAKGMALQCLSWLMNNRVSTPSSFLDKVIYRCYYKLKIHRNMCYIICQIWWQVGIIPVMEDIEIILPYLITKSFDLYIFLASLCSTYFLFLRISTKTKKSLLWTASSSSWCILLHISFTISRTHCSQHWKNLATRDSKHQCSTGWSQYQLSGRLRDGKWCARLDTWLVKVLESE